MEGGYLTLHLQVFDDHGNQTWKETAKLFFKKIAIFNLSNKECSLCISKMGEWEVKEAFDLKNKEFMFQNPLEKKKTSNIPSQGHYILQFIKFFLKGR